ncbi:MAG TPA: hypothetical protein P5137_04360 [Candidatus Brocadiia bacterium]|nr:hypothetical protein [Candidatus Brocadiia bacterium]
MTLGTRSLLFGAHQFLLHPLFVLLAWVRLYGLPGPSALVAIVVHDWGYWGCRSMDGDDGAGHPLRCTWWLLILGLRRTAELVEGHSRFACARHGIPMSRLFWADKLGTALMPAWLWVLLSRASGELAEYLANTAFEIHGDVTPTEFFWRYRGFVRHLLATSKDPACRSLAQSWTPRCLCAGLMDAASAPNVIQVVVPRNIPTPSLN